MFDNLVEPASNRGENSNLVLTWKNRVFTGMNRNEPGVDRDGHYSRNEP